MLLINVKDSKRRREREIVFERGGGDLNVYMYIICTHTHMRERKKVTKRK